MKDNRPGTPMLTRRQFLAMGVGTGAAVLAAGCGGERGPQRGGDFGTGREYEGPAVTLAFWNGFTGGDGPFMRRLVEQFNREHDNITVTMNVLQWADYYAKVPTAVSSGNGPDIGIMHIDQLATSAARNVIVPLDPVADVLGLQEADFAPAVWQAGIYNGRRYGIPLDVHPLGFYFNQEHMDQAGIKDPPLDRQPYETALNKLKGDVLRHPFWVTSTWPAHLMWQSLLWQFGGQLYSEDAIRALFNSEAGVQSLTWLVSQVKKGYSPRNVANDAQAIAFRQGKNSFTWDGIWMINEWDKVKDLEWGAAVLPEIGSQKAVWASSHNFVVFRQPSPDSNKLQAAKVFISWISEHSLEWAKAGQIPARASVRESPEFQQLDAQSTLAQQLPYVHFPPAVPGIGDITSPTFELAVNKAILLKQDPKAALDEATRKANDLLEANRRKYRG